MTKPGNWPSSGICKTDDAEGFKELWEPEAEWGLPNRDGAYPHGYPRVTVDYFGVLPADFDALAKRLLALRCVHDGGADVGTVRVLFMDEDLPTDVFDPGKIVGIATLCGSELRLETNVPRFTESLQDMLSETMHGLVKYRTRAIEDPFTR